MSGVLQYQYQHQLLPVLPLFLLALQGKGAQEGTGSEGWWSEQGTHVSGPTCKKSVTLRPLCADTTRQTQRGEKGVQWSPHPFSPDTSQVNEADTGSQSDHNK